ncbi:hypothetical protein SAMN02745245_01806 [Anaerosphaera aminiphila DSM 21120]|uniref:Pirin family protein n=1 Tax=Anaerosphaera aminiphila DSM 21120 TaxID=1120995 RepID=A0A1M5UMP4_9FIRM|nr:pirin family protein [Anaerosphaera aminiphila]SHH63983.1 hypothetical protein SAMN02745245_01806 [Anaerosphaera aminiphila DSM 21120]
MERKVKGKVTGFKTQDGAGVNLVRVLGNTTVKQYDPFLMLDSFDSKDPNDYTAGFPMHPHRGIETITFLSSGEIVHRDSLGNEGTIRPGEVQWMTAGSGILHEEMPQAAERMLGVQIWLNLPQKDKMTTPEYHEIGRDLIEEIEIEGGLLRLISGSYKEFSAFQGKYLPVDFYDIHLKAGKSFTIPTKEDEEVYLFLLENDAIVAGEHIPVKTAVATEPGTSIDIEALDKNIEILFLSAPKLDEPVAWGGPIVMNTKAELERAFAELQSGMFIKDKPKE